MKKPATPSELAEARSRLIGLGERSLHKSYYPELRSRLAELERFRRLLDKGNDAIFLVDPATGRILDALGAAGTLLGLDPSRLVGRRLDELVLPGDAGKIRDCLTGERGRARIEATLVGPEDPDLIQAPVEMTVSVARLGEAPGAVVVARDITERRRSEEALRGAEERYRGIIENAVLGVFQTRPDGQVLTVNLALANMLGFDSVAEFLVAVNDQAWRVYQEPADRRRLLAMLDKYGAVKDHVVRLRHKSGRDVWVSVNARRVVDPLTGLSAIEGVYQDITIRRMAEETLKTYHERLESRVAARTAELTEANERLRVEVAERRRAEEAAEAANRVKSEFLSVVSHEIRTPLTSVLGFAVLIEKKLRQIHEDPEADPAKRTKAIGQILDNLGIIVSEADRLKNLINDVLDLAKLEAGRLDLRMERLDPADLVRQAAAAASGLFQDRPLKLVLDLAEPLPRILGDRDRLIQVLLNLISNAVKFTAEGAVTCSADMEEGRVLLAVSDTGMGIAPEDRERIFEKFRQLSPSSGDRPRGTGLGLAICRQIVESHGGTIRVESEKGQGSSFIFTLPVAPA